MQIDAGWGDGVTQTKAEVQEPYISILNRSGKNKQQFNAASVVACGIATCKCILQSIAMAFVALLNDVILLREAPKARVVFRPVLPWRCEKRVL